MATKPLQTTSIDNPRQTFQSALAAIRGPRELKDSRTRDAARSLPIAPMHSKQQMEKRALTDAARALAQLWNVSPHLVR
jgi:hypothetical protein